MRRLHGTRVVCALLIVCGFSGYALAGGFDRFEQGVDQLFDPADVAFDVAFIYFRSRREYSTVNGAPERVRFRQDNTRTSINLKFRSFDQTACLTYYRQPFGGATDYGATWSQARTLVSRSLDVEELGLTCAYRFPSGDGLVHLIGGVTEDFATYREKALRVLPNTTVIQPAIDIDGSATGWRAGLAYEVPAIATRASIVYYAHMKVSAQGTFSQLPLVGNAFLAAVPVHAEASIPQAAEAIVQFPLAQGWLDAISVRWVDWSVWTRVPLLLSVDSGPLQAGRELSVYNAFFRDGWTVSNSVAHRLSDALAFGVRLGWDRDVSTGWTDHTSTWSAGGGAVYTIKKDVDVIGAVGLSLLSGSAVDKRAQGASYSATTRRATAITARMGFRFRM